MTVSSSTNKIIGNGNGLTTSWPFAFKVFDPDHLLVTYTDGDGNESTLDPGDYTINLNADQDASPGGTVTYSPAIASGTKLTILRSVPYTQATDLKNQGGFFPEVLERGFDLVVMQVQQLREQLARALKLSPSQSAIGELEATDAARAGSYLGFDLAGNLGLYAGVAAQSVSSAMQPVVSAASLAAARTALGVSGSGDNNTWSGTNNFDGAVDFDAAVDLGAQAVATTPAAGDNDSTLATTAFVQSAIASLLSVNDANSSPAATVRQVLFTALTAARTVTLPLANSVVAGTIVEIKDGSGSASQTIAISIARSGSDTIDGSASTQVCINIPRGSCYVMSDGSSGWHVLKWSVIYTSFLIGGNVPLSNTGQWFTGASVTVSAVGTWEVEGGISVQATDAAQAFNLMLFDGNVNVLASGRTATLAINVPTSVHLSGRSSGTLGSFSIQANCPATTNAFIMHDVSGRARDTFIKATRVA